MTELDKYIDTHTELKPEQHKALDDMIAKARATMPKESRLKPTLIVLDRLAAITPCWKSNGPAKG
jgi:hypothetical protein